MSEVVISAHDLHKRFVEGRGDDARAQVNFGRHGMKWLALSVAKLTPVD